MFSSINAQIINIPDPNFKAKLLEADITNMIAVNLNGGYAKIDINGDGEIEESEAFQIRDLVISKSNISSIEGLKKFSNLEFLACDNNLLTEIDLKSLTKLSTLICENNDLTSLDVSGLTKLSYLTCDNNPLMNLNLEGLIDLSILSCSEIGISVLDLKGLTKLSTLICENNDLTSLDLKEATNLDWLVCTNNKLKTLDLSYTKNLQTLSCGGNELTTINIENLADLVFFAINGSPLLESIFAKNGVAELYGFSYHPSPNLKYICIDDNKVSKIQASLIKIGNLNCTVNSYCSFVPGGDFYSVQGKIQLDKNNNGCDSSDINASNIKFNITDGTTKGSVIANETGNYAIKVPAGSYTITPVFENPDYFSVSPASLQVEFPVVRSPLLHDFCIAPVDSRNDLEVTLLSVRVARPSFTSDYKIIFKNKGNVAQSGNVNLLFEDSVLDLIDATPVVSSQNTNNLSWNYTNLKPFESREIKVSLKVNSPIQTPAVLNGDILNYTATISSSQIDEKPSDNTFALSQTVVGSYDPNDKTCLEGNIIKPELIGEYVHYMIRFENTGTYQAENVVVKDLIDLSKFDIHTLVPTSSSHSYITKISDGNKVEFIFEKINLPFDDANNDGYIAFKIKTLSTLTVGDSFTNEANIYFDYNFPILTNKATSTFTTTLSNQDFEFANYFNIYPNPTKDVLNINIKETIEIKSIAVYDVLGQIVIAVPNAEKVSTVDVSKLQKGNYILKIKTNLGTSASKFIKM